MLRDDCDNPTKRTRAGAGEMVRQAEMLAWGLTERGLGYLWAFSWSNWEDGLSLSEMWEQVGEKNRETCTTPVACLSNHHLKS